MLDPQRPLSQATEAASVRLLLPLGAPPEKNPGLHPHCPAPPELRWGTSGTHRAPFFNRLSRSRLWLPSLQPLTLQTCRVLLHGSHGKGTEGGWTLGREEAAGEFKMLQALGARGSPPPGPAVLGGSHPAPRPRLPLGSGLLLLLASDLSRAGEPRVHSGKLGAGGP